MLVDVVQLVGRSQDFAFVDKVDAQVLENLRFRKMPNTGFGHDWNGDSADDLFDQAWPGHAGHSALRADHRRHALQSHDRGSAGFLGNDSLLGAHHVHDDATLEHLSQAQLQPQSSRVIAIRFSHLSASHA